VFAAAGEFARSCTRNRRSGQEILVNLLGLHVYQRIETGRRAAT